MCVGVDGRIPDRIVALVARRKDETLSRPQLAYDLCCGLGGWADGFLAEGYRIVGFDIDPTFANTYPGEFVLADIRKIDGRRLRGATVIVASPPCNDFSDLRFLHNPGRVPETSIIKAVWRIRTESGVPTVIENVRGARHWFGPARCHRGSWYLWGDVPILPWMRLPPKIGAVAKARQADGSLGPSRLRRFGARDRSRRDAACRSKVPFELARAVARAFLP